MTDKLWGGRFSGGTDALVEAFTSSIEVDRRLYVHDIAGSVAHARTLARAGVLDEAELGVLVDGLEQVRAEIEAGTFEYTDSLEDIHMHVESRLAELVGDVAKKLHTGRSRNDQIATDIRLYMRDEIRTVTGLVAGLRRALVELATAHTDLVMPGYTHMQRAQPVLLSHHLMAYYEMLTRDAERLGQILGRVNVMPLGSAALAGTTYDLDREYTAGLLGFDRVSANSMDAVSDRDFALEFMFAASLIMVHLSRLCEEIILWASAEFGFVRLPDAFSTGSSIMPQKKNPDVAELVRGKAGRVFGDLQGLLVLMKGLPLAYNRDLQEDKPPLFDTVDTVKACLAVFAPMVARLEFDGPRMAQAASTGYLDATDLADYLVTRGTPFRQAHHESGRAVAHALKTGRELRDLPLEQLRQFCPRAEADVYDALTLESMVARRQVAGGTAPDRVRQAINQAQKDLEAEDTGK